MYEEHPDVCPDIVELASMLGLGLSPKAEELLSPAAKAVEDVLTWVEECDECRANLETLEGWQEEFCYPDLAVVANERDRALNLWLRLKDVSDECLAEEVLEEDCSWALCQLLLARSRDASAFSPQRAFALARLARDIASFLDPAYYSPRLLSDLQARACAYYGNALRVLGRLKEANAEFEKAHGFLRAGSGAVVSRAVVLDFLGSLRKDQRRLPEAVQALTAASEMYETAGNLPMVAKVQLNLGLVRELEGDLEGAVTHLTQAQSLLDCGKDERLFAYCQHHLVHFLTEAGYYEEAEMRCGLVRSLWEKLDNPWNLAHLRWAEARFLQGLQREGEAEEAFRETVRALQDLGAAAPAGFAALDLACFLANQGRLSEVEELASLAYETFEESGASQPALAALALLREKARSSTATAEVIRQAVAVAASSRA